MEPQSGRRPISLLKSVLGWIRIWHEHATGRRHLCRLTDRDLKDMGFERFEARRGGEQVVLAVTSP
jgi:uncharacterized protein YjiS (DUF1127 family)